MFALDGTLGKSEKELVASCETVRQQLDLLKRMKIKPQNLYSLNETLTKIRWERNETATAFLHRLNELKSKMETARGASEDVAFISKLLKEIPTFMNWTRLALQEELQRTIRKRSSGESCANVFREPI